MPRPFTVRYYGSIESLHGEIACATPDPDMEGRYRLALWSGGVLTRVRPQSFETGSVTVGEGFTCGCGENHCRDPWHEDRSLDDHVDECERPIGACIPCMYAHEMVRHT